MVEATPNPQDHAVGLEMEMVELARQADQAAHEGWPDQEAELRQQLDGLYGELATLADELPAADGAVPTAAIVDAPTAGV